jgi:acylglycerol lipase
MKTLIFISSIFILMICLSSARSENNTKDAPFSSEEISSAEKGFTPSLQFLEASDNIKLAYREYIPKQITAVLLFYHGLSNRFNIAVFTPDIRGHGDSGGERGDAPSTQQVFDDVGLFIQHIRMKYPGKALFLGGHSSGAGLTLNYSNSMKREKVQGYLFLSPQLGFRSRTERRNNPNPFATVKNNLFMENAMHGTHGNSKAVFFNYSEKTLKKDPKLITAITVNMANALTPTAPAMQIQTLDLPLAVWIGEEDELLDAVKVTSFVKKNNPAAYTKIIEKEKHLSILLTASDPIGAWIHDIIK